MTSADTNRHDAPLRTPNKPVDCTLLPACPWTTMPGGVVRELIDQLLEPSFVKLIEAAGGRMINVTLHVNYGHAVLQPDIDMVDTDGNVRVEFKGAG